jgi:hypothetical protein
MIAEVLLLFSWPVLIWVSYQAVKFAVNKFEANRESGS